VLHLVVQLGAVVLRDAVAGQLQRGADLGRDRGQRRSQLGGGDPQLLQLDPVEAFRVVAQRRVTVCPDLRQDGAHRRDRLVAVDGRTRQAIGERGRATQIETVQHVGQGTHPDPVQRTDSPAVLDPAPVSLHADLTSVMSTLDQVLERLDEAANEVKGTKDDDVATDIYEVERHLRQAARRLTRTIAALPGSAAR
jgi:hypothetical protein